MPDTTVKCKLCGQDVTAKRPDVYPYCQWCHYNGRAAEDILAADVAAARAAFPDAEFVGIEHTGGGCFWLSFRWPNEDHYYIATDGEAGVAIKPDEPTPIPNGWFYVGRQSDLEESPDYDGSTLIDVDLRGFTIERVIAAIREERTPCGCVAYPDGTGSPCWEHRP